MDSGNRSSFRRAAATGAVLLALLVLCPAAGARSPYLAQAGREGTILWSAERDFADGAGNPQSHGDILIDLESSAGGPEGTAVYRGGRNAQLIAVFYGDEPTSPMMALPQKGLDGFDVITSETLVPVMVYRSPELVEPVPVVMPMIFFTVEESLTSSDLPPLAPPWSGGMMGCPAPPGPVDVTDGDLLLNTGPVIPNYFLIEAFDLHIDPDGAGGADPVPIDEFYEWNAGSNSINIGLDAVDVEGVGPMEFEFLTIVATANSNPPGCCYGRLCELTPEMLGGLPFDFSVYFSFEDEERLAVDPPHYAGYGQVTYLLGPLHRVADGLTGLRMPTWQQDYVNSQVTDDDLLMVRFPLRNYRLWPEAAITSGWPMTCDAAVVRTGRDGIPQLGGADLGNLFRDTNKLDLPSPLGLDAIDAPFDYLYSPNLPITPAWSDEPGETGAVGMLDALLGYDPFSMALFSTSITDPPALRTPDGGESPAVFPGPGDTPPLFPFARPHIDECDLLGSDSPPIYPQTNPPNPNDGVFRGVELTERLMGFAETLPDDMHAGLDGVDVVPFFEPPTPPETPALYWKEYEGLYVPDFDQKQDPNWQFPPGSGNWSHCGPVAEANSLWWFGYRYPELFPPTMTPPDLVNELAMMMNTNGGASGTGVIDFYTGVKTWLEVHNATHTLEVHWVPDTGSDNPPAGPPMFEEVAGEIMRCQDVVLLLGFWRVHDVMPTGPDEYDILWERVGGHFVTCAGTSPVANLIAFSDPYYDNKLDNPMTAMGVVRGPNHPPPPTAHNDGVSASHDIYVIDYPSVSPGAFGGFWIPNYPVDLNEAYNVWSGHNGGQVFGEITHYVGTDPPAFDSIHAEVEYAVAVSPVYPPEIVTTDSLTLYQGGPATSGTVATVTDEKDPPGSLLVGITTPLPPGVAITLTNNGGVITADVSATCAAPPATHSIGIVVRDSDGLTDTDHFDITILPNPAPTLGAYADIGLAPGDSTTLTPDAPPADANDNITSATVTPSTLPGGGTLSVNPSDGVVSISTTAGTQTGSYPTTVTVFDACGASVQQAFTLTVAGGTPPQITITGGLTCGLGGPTVQGVVATVSDAEDDDGMLFVQVSGMPTGMACSVVNNGGSVTAQARADVTVVTGTHNVTLLVRDSDLLTDTDTFAVQVTLGTAAAVSPAAWALFE